MKVLHEFAKANAMHINKTRLYTDFFNSLNQVFILVQRLLWHSRKKHSLFIHYLYYLYCHSHCRLPPL